VSESEPAPEPVESESAGAPAASRVSPQTRRRILVASAAATVLLGVVIGVIVWDGRPPPPPPPLQIEPNSVVEIAPDTQEVLTVIPSVDVGSSLESNLRARGDVLWLLSGSRVLRVDVKADGAVERVDLRGPGEDIGSAPDGVWVAVEESVSEIIGELIPQLSPAIEVEGVPPVRVTVGTFVWVLTQSPDDNQPDYLTRIDPSKETQNEMMRVRGDDVVTGADAIWITDSARSIVTWINPNAFPTAAGHPIRLEDPPDGIAGGLGNTIVTFNTARHTVTMINGGNREPGDPIDIHRTPIDLRAGLGAAWTLNDDGTVTRIYPGGDPKTLQLSFDVNAIAIDNQTSRLWLIAQ